MYRKSGIQILHRYSQEVNYISVYTEAATSQSLTKYFGIVKLFSISFGEKKPVVNKLY